MDAPSLMADVLTYGYRWTRADERMINLTYADELRYRAQVTFGERAARTQKRVSMSSFELLPTEVLQMTFRYLSPGKLASFWTSSPGLA